MRLLSFIEAQRQFGINRKELSILVDAKIIPHVKIGERKKVLDVDITNFIMSRRNASIQKY